MNEEDGFNWNDIVIICINEQSLQSPEQTFKIKWNIKRERNQHDKISFLFFF